MTDKQITREVRAIDPRLYAKRNAKGIMCVWRKGFAPEVYDFDNDTKLLFPRRSDSFILALTDNWAPRGNPVDWGMLPILARLKEMDSQTRENFFKEFEEKEEKFEKAQERSRSNKIEDVAREWLPHFKKATADLNTASMSKDDPFRRLRDRRIKQ